jgi:tetratricopeptide (TPR) repeat protein
MPVPTLKNAARFSPAWVLFLLAVAVRLVVLTRFSHSIHFLPDGDDMKFYNDWALRIAAGEWTDGKAFYGLPGYAYCLAAIYRLTGGYNPFAVGLIQAVLEGLTAVVLYQLAILAYGDRGSGGARAQAIGTAAALGWTFYLPAQTFSVILMPTCWLVLAFYGCVWWLLRTERASWWRPWVGLGLAAGAMAMLVATILFLVPLMLVAIVLTVERGAAWRQRWPRMVAAVAVLVAGLYLGAAPAWLHNYFVAREPVMLSAHSGINFWIGNNPTATGYPRMPPGLRATQEGLLRDSITLAERAAGRSLTRAEVSRYWSERANAYIQENRPEWLRLMRVKFGNFWNAYQYDDLSIIKLLRDDGILPPGLRWGIVAALGLAGLVPVAWRFPRARWVAAAVLLHMCALLPVFVTERYRLAAVPGLLLLGAGGLWMLWEHLARGRWRAAGGYGAVAIGAAWFVSIPRGDIGLWSLDHYKAGIRATEAGDLDRAQRNLETAYAYVSTNADIRFALGNLWLARSERTPDAGEKARHRTHAKRFYRLALELNPAHVGTLNNLGVLALEEQRWEVAEKFLAVASDAEPEAAKTHYLLARARFERGHLGAAKAAIEKALALRAEQKEFLELRDKIAAAPAPIE